MQVLDTQALQAKYQGVPVKIDAFFIRRTSLVPNQTVLKLGEYNLMGAPAILSLEEAKLLAVLSPNEISLFSKYATTTNTLVIDFENPETKAPLRFHIKVQLVGIEALPARKNICMVQLRFKSVPAEYINILGSYLDEQASRRKTYEKNAENYITFDLESTKLLGYNDYAELIHDGTKIRITVEALSSMHAKIILIGGAEKLLGKSPLFLKLYFKSIQFSVECSFAAGTKAESGEAVLDLVFSNDLISLMDEYQFRSTISARKKGGESP